MASRIDEAIAPGHAQDTARPGVSLTDLLLLCTSAIWGVNYIVVKYGTEVLRPLAYNGARVALAAVVLGALAVARYRERVARRDVLVAVHRAPQAVHPSGEPAKHLCAHHGGRRDPTRARLGTIDRGDKLA